MPEKTIAESGEKESERRKKKTGKKETGPCYQPVLRDGIGVHRLSPTNAFLCARPYSENLE